MCSDRADRYCCGIRPADIFARTDFYRQARLDFPILVELFKELRERGAVLTIPADMNDAVEQLARLMKSRQDSGI